MRTLLKSLAAVTALTTLSAGCAEQPAPAPDTSLSSPTTATVFSPLGSDKPLPIDEVFMPDAHVEDGRLFFRIQILPGYYLYKEKLGVRSLSTDASLNDVEVIEEWSPVEIVIDDWFGEQEVFFNEAHGAADLRRESDEVRKVDIELSYQGCKQEDLCYTPQTKVLSVDLPAQLEFATGKTE